MSRIIDRLLIEDLEVKIPNKEDFSSLIKRLFDVFKGLKTVLKFRKQVDAVGNEAEMLIHYADSFSLFHQYYNLCGMEICMNKIAIIHYQNKRYLEAQEAMQVALAIAVKMQQKLNPSYASLVIKVKEQLIDILIDASIDTNNKLWQVVITILKDIEDETNLRTRLKLVLALAKSGQTSLAQEKLDFIENIIDEDSPYSEMILYIKAVILLTTGRTKSAARFFKQCLEMNSHYDPWVRKVCLLELGFIFLKNGLKKSKIRDALKWDFSVSKDVVLLHDYSMSMKGPRNLRSLKGFVSIIEGLEKNDRVSFITYTRLPHVLFRMSSALKNTQYMKNSILACDSPHGTSGLYDAIGAGLHQFSGLENTEDVLPFEQKKTKPANIK